MRIRGQDCNNKGVRILINDVYRMSKIIDRCLFSVLGPLFLLVG